MAQALRAVVFDFDGTLADSYAAITASVNEVRSRRGMAPLTPEQVRPHVGRGLHHLLRNTSPGGKLAVDCQVYLQHHPSVLMSGTHLLPGAAATLKPLHEIGLKLAICSNKPRDFTVALVSGLGISGYVSVVLGPVDVPNPKPAPDMLLAALQRLGVSADEALYIGDMTVDITTARAAGVRVWVVPTGSDSRDTLAAAMPDRLLNNLAEVTAELVK